VAFSILLTIGAEEQQQKQGTERLFLLAPQNYLKASIIPVSGISLATIAVGFSLILYDSSRFYPIRQGWPRSNTDRSRTEP